MKQFFIWAGIIIALYAGITVASQFLQAADRQEILVAIDVSSSLEDYKARLPEALAFLNDIRFARFKVVTNSPNREFQVIQDWSDRLSLDKVQKMSMYTTFAPAKLLEFPEIASADRVIFVTNAADTGALAAVPRSEIIRVR